MVKTNGFKNESIIISKTAKNEDPSKNSHLKTEKVKIADLPKIITSNNYSLINWIGGIRKSSNFKSASGFTVDIDEGLTIDEAQTRLKAQQLNHIIIPSKNHTAEEHRYHVLLFFSNPVYSSRTYEVIGKAIVKEMFQESDPSVTDSARFIFGSPNTTQALTYFGGNNLNVLSYDHLWTSITEIQSEDNGIVRADELNGHTICHCLFHDDSNASAFVDYSQESENWYLRCSKCDHTFWMEKDTRAVDSIMDPYWSYKRDVYEMGLMGNEFYFNPIGLPAFYTLTKSDRNSTEKKATYARLVQTKHISHISRIDYIGNVEADENHYDVNVNDGVITVHYSPIKVIEKDNNFIENYLEDRFGEYGGFIKEYLAVYSYTNYHKLPTLVLKGPRGNGKSTFAEMVEAIYEPLATDWAGIEGDFSYEAEKKFLIVEENASSDERQYKALKKYMGQTYSPVRKKFKDPYRVLNNMSIAVLSNKQIPLFVRASEMPVDAANNQFFVLEFPPVEGEIDNRKLDKLKARLGHYIRTELKTVFSSLDMTGYRYSINVPITEHEKALFEDNTTPIEADTNRVIEKILLIKNQDYGKEYYPFITAGHLPSDYINNLKFNSNEVIKNLKERQYIMGNSKRKTIDEVKLYCYAMTSKFIEKFNESQKELGD